MNRLDAGMRGSPGSFRWGRRTLLALLLVLGVAWPFLIVNGITSYSVWDLAVFEQWARCWGGDIYLNCRPNYPSVGLIASAGVVHAISVLVQTTDQEVIRLAFREYLAIFDAANFLLLAWLARLMRFRRPLLVALAVVVTPSTWVGGACWGQIDNVGLFFCLLAIIGLVQAWRCSEIGAEGNIALRSGVWLGFAALSLSFYLLSKQLAIFSVPFFGIFAALTVRRLAARLGSAGFMCSALGVGVFLLSFFALDSLFRVPPGFHDSSYWFVWSGGGSDHANQISRNGFNIWTFLGWNMESSSHRNFLNFQIWKWRDHLSPYKAGLLLYGVLLLVLGLASWRRLATRMTVLGPAREAREESDRSIATLLLFHGLCHLGFNVFLSGTHERYLYLGYPFLLLAALWFFSSKQQFTWRVVAFCFVAASAYGGFVYGVNDQLPRLLFPLHRHEFLASLHLFLLIVLCDYYFRILKSPVPASVSARSGI